MATWVNYPDCLTIDVPVENKLWIPDPLWPGVGFAIAFVIGAILGVFLTKCCLSDYLKKKSRDEEEATMIAQGIPLHLRGREKNKAFPATLAVESNKSVGISEYQTVNGDNREGAVTPSNILLDSESKKQAGLSDALIKDTGDGAVAEITQQDVAGFYILEVEMRNQRINGLILLVRTFLNKCVIANKMTEEDVDRVVKDMKNRCDDIIEKNSSEEAAALLALQNDPRKSTDSVATQTETDKIHAMSNQKTNSELASLESELPHILASVQTMNDEDIDVLMAKLKHQLATREVVIGNESWRQIQALEERLARRRELAEQNRLSKMAATNTVKAKIENQSNALQLLVNNEAITEKQKDEIMDEYEKDLWRIHNACEQERREQEDLLNEKLAKKRRIKLKKLSAQQRKAKEELAGKLEMAADDSKKGSSSSAMRAYDQQIEDQHIDMEDVMNELDTTEADQLNDMSESVRQDLQSQLVEADNKLADNLVTVANVEEEDVKKIIKLHKAEMKEFDRNRTNEQKVMESKLEERLALRRQKRMESAAEYGTAFKPLKQQQDETLQKVLHSQADIPEDAAARIMEEHNRNMEVVHRQLYVSKLRQQKQLEERLAKRKARLAEKQAVQQSLIQSGDKTPSEKEIEKVKREMEEEKKNIKQDHEQALAALKQRMEEETLQALAANEQRTSQLIGQLEVGQARRKNILQKQDKLISELENQLANKVGENPKGYTTTTELMQKHYGQVETLTNSLHNTKERQEQALQDKLEQKKLRREAEITEQMKHEAKQEMENMKRRGAGAASSILLDMMLQQRHEKYMNDLEQEMKVEMQRCRDQMNEDLNAEMMAALSDEGKSFMAEMAANSGLSNDDLSEAMNNAAKSIQANDQTVKKLAKEMRVRVKTAKGGERTRADAGYSGM